MYETYKVNGLEKNEIIAAVSLALPMNWDTTAKFNILLWWKLKGAPTFPHHVARGTFGFVHPCIQLQMRVKLRGCKEYANQEGLQVEANNSERPFICPIQPRLGVGV